MARNAAVVRKKKQKKTKQERLNTKGWMEGSREAVVMEFVPSYFDAVDRTWQEAEVKLKEILAVFHHHFPWPMKDWEEPAALIPYDPKAPPPSDDDLTPEQVEDKRGHIQRQNKRIRRWLAYRYTQAKRHRKKMNVTDPSDTYEQLMMTILGIRKPPRAASAVQQFMSDEATKVATYITNKWKGAKPPNVNQREAIARKLLSELPKDEQTEYSMKAKALAEKEKEVYEERIKAGPSKDPNDVALAVENAQGFLNRINRGVEERTRCVGLSLFAGPMAQYNGDIGSITITTKENRAAVPLNFVEWYGETKWADFLNEYKTFARLCFTDEEVEGVKVTGEGVTLTPEQIAEGAADTFAMMRDPLASSTKDDNTDSEESDNDESSPEIVPAPPTRSSPGLFTLPDAGAARPSTPPAAPPIRDENAAGGNISIDTAAKRAAEDDGEGVTPKKRARGHHVSQYEQDMAVNIANNKILFKALDEAFAEGLSGSPARERAKTLVAEGWLPPEPTPQPTPAPKRPKPRKSVKGAVAQGVRRSNRFSQIPLLTERDNNGDLELQNSAQSAKETVENAGSTHNANTITSPHSTQHPASEPPSPSREIPPSPSREIPPSPSREIPPSPSREIPPSPSREIPPSPSREIPRSSGTNEEKIEILVEDARGAEDAGWLVEAVEEFKAAAGYSEISALVLLLLKIENEHGFVRGPKVGLPTKSRPTILSKWVGNGRTRSPRLILSKRDIPNFIKSWKSWWEDMQPAWRKKKDGVWERGETKGEWGCVTRPGINGLLSIVAVMSWWGTAMVGDQDRTTFMGAVDDVRWLMEGVLKELKDSE